MRPAYFRSPMEYAIHQRADFALIIDWTLVTTFDEYLPNQLYCLNALFCFVTVECFGEKFLKGKNGRVT